MITLRQTPCFIQTPDGLKNEQRVTVSGVSGPETLAMESEIIWTGIIEDGVEFPVYIPEIQETRTFLFALASGEEAHVALRPQRKWEVHLVQFSHHDPGYTDIPSYTLYESAEHLKEALDALDARAGWPEEARPRIVIEQAYSLYQFLRSATREERARMIHHIQEGNIEVTAFWGNLISELLSPEECLRAMYPSKAVEDETGIPIVSAEHNDITGFTWGYATALQRAGVKYFLPNLPLYYSWGYEGYESFWDEEAVFGRRGPGAFWWESPEGERIFLWCNNNGCVEETDPALPTLLDELTNLEETGWPHRIYRLQVRGEKKDNSRFVTGYSDTARAWNEKYAYPRLICSTEKRFCETFLNELTCELPVRRGGVDGQDYPIASTSHMESSAITREDHALFRSAEILTSLAPEVPHDRLNRAVEDLLMADEHAYGANAPESPMHLASWWERGVYAPRAYYEFDRLLRASTHSIAAQLQADGAAPRITLINLSGLPGRQAVTVDSRQLSNDYLTGALYLVDCATGEEIPCALKKLCWDDPRWMAGAKYAIGAGTKRMGLFPPKTYVGYELCFTSPELPPYGYRALTLHRRADAAIAGPRPLNECIENEFYRVSFDKNGIVDVWDRVNNRSLLDQACPHRLGELLIRYANEEPVPACVDSVSAADGADGQTVTLRLSGEGLNWARIDLTLRPDVDNVFVHARVSKNAQPLQTLYLAFPFQGSGHRYQSVLHETAPAHDILPGVQTDVLAVQDWVHVQGSDLYWNSASSPVVSLSHLWKGYISPAHRCIMPPPPHPPLEESDYDTGWIYSIVTCNNFGTNFYPSQHSDAVYRYTFAAARGRDRYAWGAAAAQSCISVLTAGQGGSLPPMGELLSVPGLRILTLKRAENGNCLILRLQNDTQAALTAPVTLMGRAARLLNECDVLERDLAPLTSSCVTVPAGHLATIRLEGCHE